MSVCFQLFKKGSDVPAILVDVDKAMCEYFNKPCDPLRWFDNWYDTIGFSFAVGMTDEEIRESWPNKSHILDFILDHYTVDCFRQ